MTLRCMHVYKSTNFCCSVTFLEKTSSAATFKTIMENVDHDGSGENTDELLSAEMDEGVDVHGLIPLPLSQDHCDRLLDAIDVQLSHLQNCSHSQMLGGNSKRCEFPSSGCLDRSVSLSKDTGLGSTVPTNDKTASSPDWTPSEGKGDQIEHQTVATMKHAAPVLGEWYPEGDGILSSESRREQCRWRLERLLGSSEVAGMGNEEDDLTMDSICTEDFSTRFRDEMLDLSGKAPDVPTTNDNTADLTEPRRSPHYERLKNNSQHPSKTPIRHLTGIPMQSFDSVTIDTDVDTVCSEKVRQHLKSALSKNTAFGLSRENVFCAGPAIQNNIHSSSSDDEGTAEDTSGECSVSKLYSRSRRHPSGRKGKRRSSHQSRRNGTHTSTERPQDKIRMDEDQLKELRQSFANLQQQKIAMVQCLERLREKVEQTKKEQHSLQISLRDSRTQAQNIRCELHRLQAQRDMCLEEVRVLQEQQVTLVQRQKTALSYDISCHNCVSRSVSVLEREEMDRLLDNAKSELFSEQRRFRHTLDSMRERLDEVNQELEQKDEDFRALHKKYSGLEEQLADMTSEREQIRESSQEDLMQQMNRIGVLERTVAQKEVLLQGLEEEKKVLHLELCSLREEHSLKLTEIQNRTKKEKEQDIDQVTLQLTKRHQEELQMVRQQADGLRSAALTEQAQTHKQSLDSLHSCIQMKEEEVKRLKGALKQHEEKMRRQADELRGETREKIQKALKREERKWEEQREKLLREQHGILKVQIEEAVKKGKVEVEKERKNALALQSKIKELQKQAEKDALCLKQSLQHSEKELQELRAALSERDQKHQRRTARLEQQNKNWAQDIHTECVCLQDLLKHNGLTVESKHLSDSPTVHEALQTLQSLTKAVQQVINDLRKDLSSQRQAAVQLSQDKQQELCLQKEQLTEEKEEALASLKEKLIQEHIEEISSLSRPQPHMDDDDTEGLFARLRRQLQAKDDELRQVQRNMAVWKDKTTARLAHKFELELRAELERRVPKPRAEQQIRLERLENEMRHLTGHYRDYREPQSSSTALQCGSDFKNSPCMKNMASYKLLQHLQSRIHQLQAESQTRCPSPVKWDRDTRNLGGSYLDLIAPAQESCKSEGCFPARTISS